MFTNKNACISPGVDGNARLGGADDGAGVGEHKFPAEHGRRIEPGEAGGAEEARRVDGQTDQDDHNRQDIGSTGSFG